MTTTNRHYFTSQYDSELTKIPIYTVHPSLLPFIGKDYDKYRIMMVGESHYISNDEKLTINDLYGWWDIESKVELLYPKYINTRGVVDGYINDGGSQATRRMFGCPLSVFQETIIPNIEQKTNSREDYDYFAFMNFFQIPSFIEGGNIRQSIQKLAPTKQEGNELWNVAVEKSVATFDSVIDIIKPNLIVFTSILAYTAYIKSDDSKNHEMVKYTTHPNTPYSWNKPNKRFEGRTGKEELRKIFSE